MPRPWPTPPSAVPLIQLIGDTHAGTTTDSTKEFRLDKAFSDMATGKMVGTPNVALHVGDMTQNGNATEAGMIKPRLDALPWDYVHSFGEHDNFNAEWTDAQMLTFWGRTALIEAFDLDFATVITIPPGPTLAEVALVGTLADAASGDVILLSHRPLKASYGSPSPTRGIQPPNATDQGYYVGGSPTVEAAVRAVIDSRPQIKLICSGHLHSAPDVPADGLANKTVNTGTRLIAQVNASALAYVNSSFSAGADPLFGVYLSWYDDHMDVRLRNHGAGVWQSGIDLANPSARVKTVEF